MKQKYYRGKFMIAVYSLLHEGETLLALCDNIKEFATYLGVSENSASKTLIYLYNGMTKHIRLNGKLRTVEFIDVEED